MARAATALATFDSRPFFDKALRYGVDQGIIFPEQLGSIQSDFAKGIVQIAHYFGTAHLRPELELALRRMVNLVSLYLEDYSASDLNKAAYALRDKRLLAHSKAGSDMLKRLHALPENTVLVSNHVSAESQRAYLDEKTAVNKIELTEYQSLLAKGLKNQSLINFAYWLAKKMGVAREDVDDADSLIRSAMLVIYVDKAAFQMPTRTEFVRLVKAAKSQKMKAAQSHADEKSRLQAFMSDAPAEMQPIAQRLMMLFVEKDLPQIRDAAYSADKLLHGNGDSGRSYFVLENLDEDVREYERLVAKEWNRVTRGNADDPNVLASVFLCVATGMAPKDALLLKEAKLIVQRFRAAGFDTQAVNEFIDHHAPEALRSDLRRFWQEDLLHEAQEQLADTDPNWPDSHMERAIEYLRKTCHAKWKGRG